MTFLTLSLAVAALAAAPQPPECSLPRTPRPEPRVFTNADLERMAACRYQTGAQSEVGSGGSAAPKATRAAQPSRGISTTGEPGREALEADWRARWRSVDQKARKLRQQARELRQEAGEAPRDPKKRPTGRRSPSLLIGRARNLEAEARDLEEEFQETARQQGALPGWLRPKAR